MPCKDVTELLTLRLDAADRLEDYQFTKRTCGKGVGAASLLLERLGGRPAEDLLELDPATFAADQAGIEEFLTLKHLVAVQSALEVYLGRAACGPDALCAASEIDFDGVHTTIQCRIMVDLVVDAIRACGRCKGCAVAE